MINFVIVEDNETHRKRIKEIILNYMMKNKVEFDIKEFEKETKELETEIEESERNNIYIFDFELPNTNAIELSRKVREVDWASPIIVFTINGGMALETFKQRLQILDFVSKQYEAEKNLGELFDICLRQMEAKRSLKYTYKGINYNINYDKILYIYRDTAERKCVIVTDTEEYKTSLNMTEIMNRLDRNFKYTHKACIVNLKRIEKIEWKKGRIEFDDKKETYLLSKTHKKELVGYVNN